MKSSYRESEKAKIRSMRLKLLLHRQIVSLTEHAEVFFARSIVFISYGLALSLLPAFAVGAVVKSSGYVVRRNPKTYRDHPLDDGTARYDDVWGG